MKTQSIIFSFMILLLMSGCEIADETEPMIKKIEIVTHKNVYDVREIINISIENQLSDTAYHFKCDNNDLRLSHIMKKEADIWIAAEYPLWCTTMGPSGYFGRIIPSQIKNDSLLIDIIGIYKLKYTFIIHDDTVYYKSNEFEVTQDDLEVGSMDIETDKSEYIQNEMIRVSIANNLSDTACHFKCDNHDLRLSHIMKQEADTWMAEEYPLWCTAMGPSGYIGSIFPSQIKNDSLLIDSIGTYNLKYTFIIHDDTVYYKSNEFEVTDQ